MIRLFCVVNDITAVMAEGYTLIRVYTDTSEAGAFTTLDGTITLVAGAESYEYIDSDGVAATWYKTAYFGAVPGEGDKSDALKGSTSVAYATVNELRNQIGKTGETDDVELAALLDAASGAINNYCNRPDGFQADSTASARLYTGSGGPVQEIDECVSVTTVAVKDAPSDSSYTAWVSGDYIEFAGDANRPDFQPTVKGKPYTALMIDPTGDYSLFTAGTYTSRRGFRPSFNVSRGVPTVQVTAAWGYASVIPDAIKQACIIQAARWYKRGQSAWADTVGSPDLGQMMYRKQLDPDVKHLLEDGRYTRPSI